MIYRDFKGQKLSQLGFGCMRFASDPETGEIDQAKVNAMFDLAIKEGVNYFDTAYPYLGGKSEIAMAEGLSRYPRESYYLADKFPGHSLTGPIDNIALFNVSLRKCRTDYFDFYLLHNVTEWSVQFYESEEYHIIPDLLQMKKEGKIRYSSTIWTGRCRTPRRNATSSGSTASESGSWSLSGKASLRCFRSRRRQNSERCGSGAVLLVQSPVMLLLHSDFCRICRG